MKTRDLVTLAAALASFTPSHAKSLKSAPARLDPSKAYVLVEVAAVEGTKTPGHIVLARYDRAKGDVKGFGRAKDAPVSGKAGPRESTGAALAKTDGRRLHLLEVEPDFWVVEGANGTAFSLGSAGVTLAPRTITDLGVAVVANDYPDGEGPEKLTAGKLAKIALLGPFAGAKPKPVPAAVTFRSRGSADMPVPEALRPHVVAADWSGPVKFGNHLGGLVNRMGGRKARGQPAPPAQAAAPSGAAAVTAASGPGS